MNEIEKKRNQYVVKANELIQKSRFSLSTQQQKIVLYLISQISPFDEDFKLYEFKITDFCEVCNINYNGSYDVLKEQIQKIANKSIWVRLPDGRETLVRWIERPYIDEHSGTIQIKLDELMKPYLLQLTANFTKYELIYTLHFKSKYTIRLYELIKSIHYKDLEVYKKEYSVDEIRTLLDAENYTLFKNFHTRVLKPAVNEINEYSDKSISYEIVKYKKKAISIIFTISSKDPIETIEIRSEIEKEFDENQMTLWDRINEG